MPIGGYQFLGSVTNLYSFHPYNIDPTLSAFPKVETFHLIQGTLWNDLEKNAKFLRFYLDKEKVKSFKNLKAFIFLGNVDSTSLTYLKIVNKYILYPDTKRTIRPTNRVSVEMASAILSLEWTMVNSKRNRSDLLIPHLLHITS